MTTDKAAGTVDEARVAPVNGIEQAHAIERLRREAFLQAPEFFVLTPRTYEWGENDQRGCVLAVWDNQGAPLATLCGAVATTRADAEDRFECILPFPVSRFPALLLSRAATRVDHRSRGLNTLLRYYFLQMARRQELRSILSLVFEGAPRIRMLERLGYDLIRIPSINSTYVSPRVPPLIGSLCGERIATASALLETLLRDLFDQYPWRGPGIISLPPRDTP
jgi:hypothetical protein